MGVKFNPFTSKLDVVDSPDGDFDSIDVSGDITLDDGGTYTTTIQAVTATQDRTISFPDATGTVALVNGANGTIQYNDAGTLNGNSDFTVDPDWNDAAVTFTGLKLNVTNTASAADSNLLDLQVGGSVKARINADGTILSPDVTNRTAISPYSAYGYGIDGSTNVIFAPVSQPTLQLKTTLTGSTDILTLDCRSGGSVGFGDALPDLLILRDAAGTLAQRNGTNAQTFRLYNTYTDASNFERTSITRDSSGLVIDAQKGGTGVDPTNLLDVKLDGTSKLLLNNSGDVIPSRWLRIANDPVTVRGEGVYLASTSTIRFVNGSNAVGNTPDVGLARDSAGVVKVTDGSTGTGYLKLIPNSWCINSSCNCWCRH